MSNKSNMNLPCQSELYARSGSLSNDDDAEDDFHKRNSRFSIYAPYTDGSKNVFKLNVQRRRLIRNENTKN